MLPYENLDIEEAAAEFHLHGRPLFENAQFDQLRELYAEYTTLAQWHNKKEMPRARQRMQQALAELFAARRPEFDRHRFDHIGGRPLFLVPRGRGER